MTVYDRTNIHPNFRSIGLHHIRQLRRMIRENRYVPDAKSAIKRAQLDLLSKRRVLAEAKAEVAQ
ncbi:MAG TPA: hypothetical protein ENK53_03530 [Thiotrichales bacterium]|nr:hypothetical protein [Thiotrichales bacterium]